MRQYISALHWPAGVCGLSITSNSCIMLSLVFMLLHPLTVMRLVLC